MAFHLRGLLPLFIVFGSGVSVIAGGPKAPESLLANANLNAGADDGDLDLDDSVYSSGDTGGSTWKAQLEAKKRQQEEARERLEAQRVKQVKAKRDARVRAEVQQAALRRREKPRVKNPEIAAKGRLLMSGDMPNAEWLQNDKFRRTRSLMRREEPEEETTAMREDKEQYDLERTQWWGHHAVLPNTYRHDEDRRREELLSQQRFGRGSGNDNSGSGGDDNTKSAVTAGNAVSAGSDDDQGADGPDFPEGGDSAHNDENEKDLSALRDTDSASTSSHSQRNTGAVGRGAKDKAGLAQQHHMGRRSEIDRLATSLGKLKAGEINKIKEILAIAQQKEVGQKQEQHLHHLQSESDQQSESDLQQGAGHAHSARQFPGGLGHLVNTPGIGDAANSNSNDNAEDRFHHMTYESGHSMTGADISHSGKEQDSSDTSDTSGGDGNSDPSNDSKAAGSSDTGGTDSNERETGHKGNPNEKDTGGDDGSSAPEKTQTVQERRADEERGLGPRDAGPPQTPGPEGFDSDGRDGVADGDAGEAREANPSGASFLEIGVRSKQPRPIAERIAAAQAAAASATDMGFYADPTADAIDTDATADARAYSVSGEYVSTAPGTTELDAGTEGGDGADYQGRQEPAQREKIQYITDKDGEMIFPER